mmetsp:Transcript_42989/g.103938  ORF Transcript_42989/g.103938 Transcript_42989/m.103938 type:complete len:753 (+) Transcript_42989:135-2393(+)
MMNTTSSNVRDIFRKWMITAALFSSIGVLFYPSPCSSFLVSTDGRTCPLVSQRQHKGDPSSIGISASSTEDGIEALERAKKQFERMTADQLRSAGDDDDDLEAEIREYVRYPANTLKIELKSRGLPTKGRKPDLARRLAEFEYQQRTGIVPPPSSSLYNAGSTEAPPALSKLPTNVDQSKEREEPAETSSHGQSIKVQTIQQPDKAVTSFCGIKLSDAARDALTQAKFETPTPVQRDGIPLINQGESVLLHAETGSGKSLAYLLPITEHLWRQKRNDKLPTTGSVGDWRGALDDNEYADDDEMSYAFILTPTRELAAQVAGVASVLAPPGTVRLVTHPTNLASDQRYWKERQGDTHDNKIAQDESYHLGRTSPRIFVGSAKSIVDSLYGNKKMPASPTRKPAAQLMLKQTRWVVLDEVDRLLLGTGGGGSKKRSGRGAREHHHEKPAAILTSAVTRRTLGRAQIIAASATMGRPLKREVSRVLGLGPKEWPTVVTGKETNTSPDGPKVPSRDESQSSGHVGRAITIPDTVQNYILPVDTSSVGKLLTNAFYVLKALNNKINDDASGTASSSRVLLVLTKSCGLSTVNAVGALKHFGCRNPEPQSLLDVLQDADSTDQLMEVHRQVSKSSGIGVSLSDSSYFQDKDNSDTNDDSSADSTPEDDSGDGYLLVTGEDTVRGLHLDGLDTVVVVGRAPGPDEYIHISGRTGRAGKRGRVINVLSDSQAVAVKGWEKMLDTNFEMLNDIDDVSALES